VAHRDVAYLLLWTGSSTGSELPGIAAVRLVAFGTSQDLAAASALSVATIRRAELTESQTALTSANDLAIRRALESAGVEFIDENGGGPGVRLRKRRLPQPPS
jgi:hypothetical protein